jgi:hypothetical protein
MVSPAQEPQDIVLEPVFVGSFLSDDGDSALLRHASSDPFARLMG